MHFIISFCRNHFSREKYYWVLLASISNLRQIKTFIGHITRRELTQNHLTGDFIIEYLKASILI